MTRTGPLFAVGAAAVLAALTAVSVLLVGLARDAAAAQETARGERAVGEALLRMDLALVPLLAAAGSAWSEGETSDDEAAESGDQPPFACRRFSWSRHGGLAMARGATADDAPVPIEALRASPATAPPSSFTGVPPALQNAETQSFAGRQQIQTNFESNFAKNSPPSPGPLATLPLRATFNGPDERLFFVRRSERGDLLQGIESDWPRLSRWLLALVSDVLPAARLRPTVAGDTARRLAALPVALEPGPLPPPDAPRGLPLGVVLAICWAVVVAALVAAGLALRAAHALAARRALFVASVTHELRTPLTTFRMYADMLASGMVPEHARADYHATLRAESDRLTRIVESVLLFSRLEDGARSAHRTTLAAADLCARIVPLLRQRCGEAGRELGYAPPADAEQLAAFAVHVDPQAVEQILHNLVDNACKYAAPGAVTLSVRIAGDRLECDVRDTGPGIAAADAARLFAAFQRGAPQQSGTVPGLGLGLSIARGLAEALGGDLALCDTGPHGTTFRLRLPRARTI